MTDRGQPLDRLGFAAQCFNVTDSEKFLAGLKLIKESLFDKGATLYCADNIITWNRNYSFLRDSFFLGIVNDEKIPLMWRSIVWRTYILLYFAEIASKADGDYLDLGCHTGYTASQIIKKVNFRESNKKFYLYDLFEWKEGDQHTHLEGHDNPNMYEDVKQLFSEFDFVNIIKGSVPESFSLGFPERIAFAHIDMNHPEPEAGALKIVLPKLAKGGVVVFDDYGWWGYSEQKRAMDPIIEANGLKVLELPTGQGLLMR